MFEFIRGGSERAAPLAALLLLGLSMANAQESSGQKFIPAEYHGGWNTDCAFGPEIWIHERGLDNQLVQTTFVAGAMEGPIFVWRGSQAARKDGQVLERVFTFEFQEGRLHFSHRQRLAGYSPAISVLTRCIAAIPSS